MDGAQCERVVDRDRVVLRGPGQKLYPFSIPDCRALTLLLEEEIVRVADPELVHIECSSWIWYYSAHVPCSGEGLLRQPLYILLPVHL